MNLLANPLMLKMAFVLVAVMSMLVLAIFALRDKRVLGITLCPVRGPAREVYGTVCLLSDLTEITSLRAQARAPRQALDGVPR